MIKIKEHLFSSYILQNTELEGNFLLYICIALIEIVWNSLYAVE